jgi:carbohydrate diacid regulator
MIDFIGEKNLVMMYIYKTGGRREPMLTRELAQTIVGETMQRVNRNINLFDVSGNVLASGDPSRIGQFHEAAMEAMKRKEPLVVEKRSIRQWKGAQPGINLPIEYGDTVVGAVGISGDPDEVKPYAELVKMAVELMLRQEQASLDRNWKQSIANRVSEELLESPCGDVQDFNRRLRPIPFTLRPPYQVAVVAKRSAEVETEPDYAFLPNLSRRFSHCALVSLHPSGVYVLIFSGQSPSRVRQMLDAFFSALKPEEPITIGVGTSVQALEGLPDSFRESMTALRWDEAGGRSIFYYEDLSWKAMLREISPASKRRMEERFASVLAPKLRETLDALFACNLNIAAAAKRLGIHRNTMIYRLERIRVLSGYNPLDFQDAVALQMALWLKPIE